MGTAVHGTYAMYPNPYNDTTVTPPQHPSTIIHWRAAIHLDSFLLRIEHPAGWIRAHYKSCYYCYYYYNYATHPSPDPMEFLLY